jgi:large subunit ribosomal protein L16
MLMPKRVKRRKVQRGRMTGKANRGNKIAYGEYGLVALEPCWMTSNQLESGRIAINRCFQRGGKVWINVFPNKPVTKKPADTRMGSGKGSPEYWVAVVKPGRVIFEVTANSEALMKKALKLAQYKLPIKTKIVSKEDLEKLDVTPEVKEAK